jgi:nucleotide-binding universal stress UspA family protein
LEVAALNILCFAYRKPFTAHALEFAKLIAKQPKSNLHLLYVSKFETGKQRGEAALREAQKQLEGLNVSVHVEAGKPFPYLAQYVEEYKIDLLVVGSLPRGGLLGERRQKAIAKLVSKSPVSTVVVRQSPQEIKDILICTGGLPIGEAVIKEGAELAKSLGAKATLLFVAGSVPSMYTGLAEVEEEMHELLKTDTPIAKCLRRGAEIINSYGVEGELELRHGVVTEQILRESDIRKVDLIVIGASRSASDLRGLLLGDVTQEVVNGANVPVLIVK